MGASSGLVWNDDFREPKAWLPDSYFFSLFFLKYVLGEMDTNVCTLFFIYS